MTIAPVARNGVDVPTLFATLDAVKANPELGNFQFRARNRWVSGTHSRSTIHGFFGASQGTFLAVDWALMTEIIPKAASGRYMGLSNVVTASSTTIAVAVGGPLIDALNRSAGVGTGERVQLLIGIGYFLVGALCLRPVREPPRVLRGAAEPEVSGA